MLSPVASVALTHLLSDELRQRRVTLSDKYLIPFKFYEGAAYLGMCLTHVSPHMSVSYWRVERLTPAKCYYGGDISPGELLPRIQRNLDMDVCIVTLKDRICSYSIYGNQYRGSPRARMARNQSAFKDRVAYPMGMCY